MYRDITEYKGQSSHVVFLRKRCSSVYHLPMITDFPRIRALYLISLEFELCNGVQIYMCNNPGELFYHLASIQVFIFDVS